MHPKSNQVIIRLQRKLSPSLHNPGTIKITYVRLEENHEAHNCKKLISIRNTTPNTMFMVKLKDIIFEISINAIYLLNSTVNKSIQYLRYNTFIEK